MAEVQFFGDSPVSPLAATSPLGFEYLTDTVQTSPSTQPKELDLVFALSSAQAIRNYQLGASTSGPLKASWELSGANSPAGPWTLLDSTFGNYTEVPTAEFVVTTLEAQCPFGYTPHGNTTNSSLRTVSSNTADPLMFTSNDLLLCATQCDAKGLACNAYTAKMSTVDSVHCTLYGADYTKRENGVPITTTTIPKEEAGTAITLCHKAGLVDW